MIAETLKQCGAQQRPDEQRDWTKYADHTAVAVFGARGNREQARLGKYAHAWKRLEGRDPQAERQAAIAEQEEKQEELQAKLQQEQKEQDRSKDQDR